MGAFSEKLVHIAACAVVSLVLSAQSAPAFAHESIETWDFFEQCRKKWQESQNSDRGQLPQQDQDQAPAPSNEDAGEADGGSPADADSSQFQGSFVVQRALPRLVEPKELPAPGLSDSLSGARAASASGKTAIKKTILNTKSIRTQASLSLLAKEGAAASKATGTIAVMEGLNAIVDSEKDGKQAATLLAEGMDAIKAGKEMDALALKSAELGPEEQGAGEATEIWSSPEAVEVGEKFEANFGINKNKFARSVLGANNPDEVEKLLGPRPSGNLVRTAVSLAKTMEPSERAQALSLTRTAALKEKLGAKIQQLADQNASQWVPLVGGAGLPAASAPSIRMAEGSSHSGTRGGAKETSTRHPASVGAEEDKEAEEDELKTSTEEFFGSTTATSDPGLTLFDVVRRKLRDMAGMGRVQGPVITP